MVCGLSARVLGTRTNSRQQRLPADLSQRERLYQPAAYELRSISSSGQQVKYTLQASDRCWPRSGRQSPCRGDTTSDRTDAGQGRYQTNPKRSLSAPQRPSQTPQVDFHGRAHNESSLNPVESTSVGGSTESGFDRV